ncbi:MAG TPA: GNAT family N-acetyltransferase [Candidatus Bathyarchaeia archaeon]|nr:GNAT family N-acetyltransferase [Candidatus Bathyarchaeia archaeon]
MAGEPKAAYTTKELGADTWPDFERLFEKHNGVQGGCWCMFYQRPHPVRAEMSRTERTTMNRKDKREWVREGRSHGIIVYKGRTPVGWCQYGPREELPRIDAGRNYRKVEPLSPEKRLWRITCFFVDKDHRGKGIANTALRATLESIGKQGGGIVEAYPVVSKKILAESQWIWFGTPGMFKREKFKPVAQLGASYLLMRRTLSPS